MSSLLEEMATRLALEFCRVGAAEIEDAVSLCVWVRRVLDVDLTLEQADQLRKLLEVAVAKFPKVVIYVEGGCVQSVMSNDPRVRVVLIDQDNIKQAEDPAKAEEEAREGTEECIHEIL